MDVTYSASSLFGWSHWAQRPTLSHAVISGRSRNEIQPPDFRCQLTHFSGSLKWGWTWPLYTWNWRKISRKCQDQSMSLEGMTPCPWRVWGESAVEFLVIIVTAIIVASVQVFDVLWNSLALEMLILFNGCHELWLSKSSQKFIKQIGMDFASFL